VLEDPRKLPGHPLHLRIGKAQPGKLRYVEHLISLNHGRGFYEALGRARDAGKGWSVLYFFRSDACGQPTTVFGKS
jgi:hypothetical protein